MKEDKVLAKQYIYERLEMNYAMSQARYQMQVVAELEKATIEIQDLATNPRQMLGK